MIYVLLGMNENYCYFALSEKFMKKVKTYLLPVVFSVMVSCGGGNTEESVPDTVPGGDAEISFETTVHDLGTIVQGETVGYNFRFINEGKAALVIYEASASCGCTVPSYSRKPIDPGKSGSIEVVFDSAGRIGRQNKTVTIRTNSSPATVLLTITADVIRSES